MRDHNICFHSEIGKIIFELSSVLPLIWSSFLVYQKSLCVTKIKEVFDSYANIKDLD